MRNSWIIALLFLSLVSCGTFKVSNVKYSRVKSVLAITETGDTIAVPYRDFLRDRHEYQPRYNYNGYWYWNNWNNFNWNNSWWGWNDYYWNNNTFIVPNRSIRRPRIEQEGPNNPTPPRTRGRRGERIRYDQDNRTNSRSQVTPQVRDNGRVPRSREELRPRQTRPQVPTFSQPRQIRGGSRPSGTQQPVQRSSSSKQGGRRSQQE